MDIETMKLAIDAMKEIFDLENVNRIIKLENNKEYEVVFKRSSIQHLEGKTKLNRIAVFEKIYQQILIGQLSVELTTALIWAGLKAKQPKISYEWLLDEIPKYLFLAQIIFLSV